jgi:hypothetical protein
MYRVPKDVGLDGLVDHGGENRDIVVLGEPNRFGNGIVLCLMVDECSMFYDIRLSPIVVHGFPEGVENAALKFTGCYVVGTRRQWSAQF